MSGEISDFLNQYDPEWIGKFLRAAFGKYHYVHTLSSTGLDWYLSNTRSVAQFYSDDIGCVSFHVGHDRFNFVDYKDPKLLLETIKRYLNLKAFI